MYYVILVEIDGKWVDEGYSTTESDKDTELKLYQEIFGAGNVRLVSKTDWDAEIKNDKDNLKAYRHLKEEQDDEYRACLKKDVELEKKVCKNDLPIEETLGTKECLPAAPKELRPNTLEELRRRRLVHFDFTDRRMTRSSSKKLGKNIGKKLGKKLGRTSFKKV